MAHEMRTIWKIVGHRSGPCLVVKGAAADLECLANRLRAIPTIGFIEGSVVFAPVGSRKGTDLDADVKIAVYGTAEDSYWSTLGQMAALGMIRGRGVPQRWVASGAARLAHAA